MLSLTSFFLSFLFLSHSSPYSEIISFRCEFNFSFSFNCILSLSLYSSLVYEKLGIPENTPPFGFGNILDTNNSSLSRMKAYEALVKPHQTTTNNNNDFQVPFILYGGHFIFLVPPPPPSLPPPSPVSFTFKRLNDDQTMKIYRSFFGKTQFAAVDPILSLQKTG